MMRWTAAAALVMVPAGAQAMDVATFLAKANALKAKGVFAIGSPDIGLLKAEMEGVTRDYQRDKLAADKAGKPISCPPKDAKMSSGELLAAFETIPPARRTVSVKTAFYQFARKRWPCPAR